MGKSEESVLVVVRCRPLNEKEVGIGIQFYIHIQQLFSLQDDSILKTQLQVSRELEARQQNGEDSVPPPRDFQVWPLTHF